MTITQAISTTAVNRFPKTCGIAQERSTDEDAWARFVDTNVCVFSYATQGSGTFSVEARARSGAGFTVARLVTAGGPAQLERTRTNINSDNKAAYALYLPNRGFHDLNQFNRQHRVEPGNLTIVSTADPFLQVKPGNNDTICLLVAAEFFDQRALHMEDHCARVISGQSGMARLFCDTLLSFERESSQLSDQQFSSAIHKVSELALLAVTAPADHLVESLSVAATHLANAKRVIRRRLTDPTLGPEDVAQECRLSLRYLHKLFQRNGRSLMEYLLAERLQHARQMLENAPARATVTDICFASGFSNASQFSTAFRRAFAVSPREVLHNIRSKELGVQRKAAARENR